MAVVRAAVLGVLASTMACGFNDVIQRDEEVKAAWGEVQNQYQRRADLVPNLVSVVKGVSGFEQETLTRVAQARASVAGVKADASVLDDPEKFRRFEQAQQELSGSLSRLLVVSERYPELKASDAYRDLMAQLEGTENRIAVARKRYVESVGTYNRVVLEFPSMVGAKLRGKESRPSFTATTAGAEKAPEVKF